MKVLTVRQPWAWLLVSGRKDIENRTWRTKYRGPLLIQASKQPDEDAAWRYVRDTFGLEIPDRLDYGGVVGVVTLVDCVEESVSPWFTGPVGWIVKDVRVLPFMPLRGRLTLFDAPEEIEAEVQRILAKSE